MSIVLKRAYEPASPEDGHRVLVDRIWPRGLSKDEMKIDEWLKEFAPSDQLRKAFHKDELSWGQFRNAYLAELKNHRDELRGLERIAKEGRLTLVFSAHDEEHNNAVVLKDYLNSLG